MTENTIGIIILNYNGLDDTCILIESIQANVSQTPYEIIIVDNASKGNDADVLEEKYGKAVTLLRSPQNVGYAAGNNIGLRYAVSRGIRYYCILNNDTIVIDDFFPAFLRYLDLHEDVAFVGPVLVDPEMRVQSTGARIRRFKAMSYDINPRIKYDDLEQTEIPCDMLVGACMMFTRETLDLTGYLPEAYFLCFEETEWCLKAKGLGKKIVCLAPHYIIHKEHVSLKRVGGLTEYLMVRNRVVFARRNLPKPLLPLFLLYNTSRLIYQSIVDHADPKQLLKYQHDGLTGHVDKRFPFIWINED